MSNVILKVVTHFEVIMKVLTVTVVTVVTMMVMTVIIVKKEKLF